jgi:hypothetical protein
MDRLVYTIGLHVYQFKLYSGGVVFNIFLASFQFPLNDGTAVLFPTFGSDMAYIRINRRLLLFALLRMNINQS